ncbi:MAG: tRNA (adenosine(37)-N6)-threonylcarbamoyltransferase complex ATPase subunit type 1 TsaE [Rubellimicrobium sp.]|nr:tRNA (adenosine(37)-N6)-threonylcarbamoyltransferase complex ATPase subunit type 1 TsaE [Rubellimicrobium sp.]
MTATRTPHAAPDPTPRPIVRLALADEGATADLARRLSVLLVPGDTVLLAGPIGAGKTTFARALIRAAAGNPDEEVPSPTFTLVQTYATPRGEIWHADLYRLGGPDEVAELGLDEAMTRAICLIEWPDRLGDLAPGAALTLTLDAGPVAHEARLEGDARWAERLGAILD